jgi:hypothetical protein
MSTGRYLLGVLGPTRRGDVVLDFLLINRTLIRLRLEDFWKGITLGWFRYRNRISRLG